MVLHCEFLVQFGTQLIIALLFFESIGINAADCSQNSNAVNHTIDEIFYTQHINSYLIKGEFYNGPSFDIMPDDLSLSGLIKTTIVYIDKKTHSLNIRLCSTLLRKENSLEHYAIQKELLKNCLNFLIEKHHITYIVFEQEGQINKQNSHNFDQKKAEANLVKNKDKIPISKLSEELIEFFDALHTNVKHILFYNMNEYAVEGIFADTDTFNKITNITEDDIPDSIPERPKKFYSSKNEQVNEYLKTIGWTETSYHSNVHHYLLKIKEKNIVFLNVRFLKYMDPTQSNTPSSKKPFYQSNKFILVLLSSTVFALGFALFFFKPSYIFNAPLYIFMQCRCIV